MKIYPLSLKEILSVYSFKNNEDKYEKFDKYLKYGGMPIIVNMNDNEEMATSYLNDIKDVVFLDNLIKYMASVIGNLTTSHAIAEFMRKSGSTITNETVNLYLKMIENAMFYI